MTYYRLLRDNKETGPFPEEEMIAKGFKPYDLIWVEGRSAGWRYPSEIPAFKNFAPVVEEQPYDRFYKKQPPQKLFGLEEKNTRANSYQPVAITNEPVQVQEAAPAPSVPDHAAQPAIQSLPGRHIHVTLPSGNTVSLTTVVTKKENKEPKDTETVKPLLYASPVQPAMAEPVYEATRPPVNNAFSNIHNNNIPADQTATGTLRTMPVYARPTAAGFSWSLIAAAFIGIATLVGLGIMIGLAISRDKNDMAFNESLRNKSKQALLSPGNGNTKPASTTSIAPATVASEPLPQPSAGNKELVQNAVVKTTIVPAEIYSKETKKIQEEKSSTTDKNKTDAAVPGETAALNRPAPVIINVEKSLSLTANDFKTGAFGGISGLKYTLFNGSKFILESVEVEVDYVQANNKVFKTEKILFNNISAGAQLTIDAPASNRGVKINSRIIKVNAKDPSLTNTTAKS